MLTALNRWHDGRHLAANFGVTSYEAMHRSAADVLRQTICFLGLKPHEDYLRTAVEFAAFDKMKEYERVNLFNDEKMSLRGHVSLGAKVREGRVGGYRDYLSEADIDYIDQRLRHLGNPFAEYSQSSVQLSNFGNESQKAP